MAPGTPSEKKFLEEKDRKRDHEYGLRSRNSIPPSVDVEEEAPVTAKKIRTSTSGTDVVQEAGADSADNLDEGAGAATDDVAGAQAYLQMLDLMENQDLIYTAEDSQCPICFSNLRKGEGILLRDCLHSFCRNCLIDYIQYSDDSSASIRCPYRGSDYECQSVLQEREIKGLVPVEMFEKYLERSVKLAENNGTLNSYHCKTQGCPGWCEIEDGVRVFLCPVCKIQHEIPETRKVDVKLEDGNTHSQSAYQKLLEMEKQDIIYTTEDDECPLCFGNIRKGEGIILKDCLHTFCRVCLSDCVQYSTESTVNCPYPDHNYPCKGVLQEREIKALVSPDIFEAYLVRSVKQAENRSVINFHCQTPNCPGWCVVEGNVRVFNCPVCNKQSDIPVTIDKSAPSYRAMVELMENRDLVLTTYSVDCPVCFNTLSPGEGVILRECLHVFCKDCLVNCVQYADNSTATVGCPYSSDDYSCTCSLQEREVKALVPPDVFEKYLARSIRIAENQDSNSFHCKTPNCSGWCVFENNNNNQANPEDNVFDCPVCKKQNCLTCGAIHETMNCKEYQRNLHMNAETDEDAKKSLESLRKLIKDGQAMHCPKCNVVVIKTGGCDGMMCTYCKTEICWATKGPRWGPKGRGDITGGCRCNVNGKKCHPKCGNCH